MDIEYTQDFGYNFNDCNSESFVFLEEFSDYLNELGLDFVYPFNSKIIDFENLGSLLVLSDNEIINIKYAESSNPYDKVPLKMRKSSKFKKISGQDVISNQRYTYIHDKKGDLYKFRSSQSLEKIKHSNVLYLKCFDFFECSSVFIMISIIESKVVLYIYDKSFDREYSGYHRSIDLILPEDCIQTLENEITYNTIKENYKFSCEMVYKITENDLDVEFFNIFLGLDIQKQNIKDILLVSMNDRLLYIKYHGTFEEDSNEMSDSSNEHISMETVIISRGKIKAIKYMNSSIMIIDDFWVLTIYYLCIYTNVIKRKEIPLGDEITCYRFTDDLLIYSNRYKIVFMRFNIAPADPEIVEVNLTLVATFAVSEKKHNFIVAIDMNKFFYYVPIPNWSRQHDNNSSDEEYTKITDNDLKRFPETLKYLENVEQDFKKLSEAIHHESDMLILLTHLEGNDNVIAGHAKIKYLPFLTATQEIDIICDPINAQSGQSYIRIVVDLETIFCAFKFTIAFYRHTKYKGVIVRHIEINPRNENKTFAIYVPDEVDDSPENKIELFAHFYLKTTDEAHTLQFPFTIDNIKVSSGYNSHKNVEIENCIKSLNKLLKDEK